MIVFCVSAPADANWRDRSFLADANAALLREWIRPLVDLSPNCVLVMVTNPVDAMTYLALQLSGLPPERVIGTGYADRQRSVSFVSI